MTRTPPQVPKIAAVVVLWAGLAAGAAAQGSAATDRIALEALYDATGGPGWTDNTNWKTSAPLDEWYGVTTDANGRVTDLKLHDNSLEGPIPDAIGDLSKLDRLHLFSNVLSGPIPNALERLISLRTLSLSWNDLTGPVPAWVGNMPGLLALYLSGNNLTGGIPDTLANLNLWGLGLSGNDLSVGPLPGWLQNHTNLRWLYMSGSGVTGRVPTWLGNLPNLDSLYLGSNDLEGPIPAALGGLANLTTLSLGRNDLEGLIPAALGGLTNLDSLYLGSNDLEGPIPASLGGLANLTSLDLAYNWGLTGSLPLGLRASPIEYLGLFVTGACAPGAWRGWLHGAFLGPWCDDDRAGATIDVAMVYTPSARAAAGGTAAIEADIDLMIAETNVFYESSGVRHRIAMVERAEVAYTSAGDSSVDLDRLWRPGDGHMDEVPALRDRVGADLVHLIVGEADVCGRAHGPGAFGLTMRGCGAHTFAHEVGHNLGLRHDRYQSHHVQGDTYADPAYGYVNQRGFEAGAAASSRWLTIMSYWDQCEDAGIRCSGVPFFSTPRLTRGGDPLGVAFGEGGSGLTGPADAVAVLNTTGPAAARWRDAVDRAGVPDLVVEAQWRELTAVPGESIRIPARVRNQGRSTSAAATLTYWRRLDGQDWAAAGAGSVPALAPGAVSLHTVDLVAPAAAGNYEYWACVSVVQGETETDNNCAYLARVRVSRASEPFIDDPLQAGVTPIRAVHFTELRRRIDALRTASGLPRFAWTDPVLRAGATPVRVVHLTEMRTALMAAYSAAGRPAPRWTGVGAGSPIRAAHLTELRAAVVALE